MCSWQCQYVTGSCCHTAVKRSRFYLPFLFDWATGFRRCRHFFRMVTCTKFVVKVLLSPDHVALASLRRRTEFPTESCFRRRKLLQPGFRQTFPADVLVSVVVGTAFFLSSRSCSLHLRAPLPLDLVPQCVSSHPTERRANRSTTLQSAALCITVSAREATFFFAVVFVFVRFGALRRALPSLSSGRICV